MSEPHPIEQELLSFIDADLPPEQLARIERHLDGCASCARQIQSLREVVDGIASTGQGELDVERHVASVMQRLDETPKQSAGDPRAWWGGGLAAVAAAAAMLILLNPSAPETTGEWTARGGETNASLARDVGVQLYLAGEATRPLSPGQEIESGAALTAGFRNLAHEPAYLLLFAVDAEQVIHWIAPQYTEPGTDPESLQLSPSQNEQLLPSAVVFDDLAPGALNVFVVLTPKPQHVSDVEALSGGELQAARLNQLFPRAEVRQLALKVRSGETP